MNQSRRWHVRIPMLTKKFSVTPRIRLSIALFCGVLICGAVLPRCAAQSVRVYQSSDGGEQALVEQRALRFSAGAGAGTGITVDESRAFQRIDGFGASLTESSAWLLSRKLTPAQRSSVFVQLFDPDRGIGLSILRQPMGSSDFSLTDYSYDDISPGESDPQLGHFSIERDRRFILPMLREALAVNPKIKIIASPWSPPGWMKTSGSMIGGTLLPASFAPLAKYFVRFAKSYRAEGVPIFAVTPQNEPRNIPADYPGMGMTAGEQTTLIRDHLGPAFRAARLNTRIMAFDHNWDMMDFPSTVLSDPQAASFVYATATHCYGGTWDAQSNFHARFPDTPIWLTECSGGNWQKGDLLVEQTRLIIQTTRNWASAVVLWNLALDQEHGPHLGGCTNCRAVVTIDQSTEPPTVIRTVDFIALAHASKFARPGAVRIDSTSGTDSTLEHVAFRNTDGSVVLLVLNSSDSQVAFHIAWQGLQASYTLAPKAVATFHWRSSHN
jgi:glucosylceramidase